MRSLRHGRGRNPAHAGGNRRARRRRPALLFDYLVLLAAVAVFVFFARFVRMPQVALSIPATVVLTAILIAVLCSAGWPPCKKTRFE